ncbi:8-oxo-dGTP diphosphatase [Aerococcaceae bacterium zg-ZJ1578]|uniref:NUDIX domain-containing protein n=1 Tax=Aerococcaceae bacterium zg-252 TaxID=2796928 RepID=UPI001A272E4D|nr:8-oxo-dGTP diphosphatase [Aerococcaceae bacterium zg-1578]
MNETVKLYNMCMVYDDSRILVQERKKSTWSGIVFPGGKVEPRESFVRSTIREIKEETGLTIWNLELCGVKQWYDTAKNIRNVVLLYKTNQFEGELKSSVEGEVFWIERDTIDNYVTAENFKEMLAIFEGNEWSEHYYDDANGEWVSRYY